MLRLNPFVRVLVNKVRRIQAVMSLHRDSRSDHGTVKEVVAITPPSVAVMVVLPEPVIAASPFAPVHY